MPNIFSFLLYLLALAHWPIQALAFIFTFTAPTQYDDLHISWIGGSGPFSLLITPLRDVPINISLPDASFDTNSNTGSYSLQLPLPAKQQFLLSMSDSTGFASGGISDVLTVGSSISGAACNTTGAIPPYTFQLTSVLRQCEDFTFSGFNGSVPPVTILGLIPLGQPFELETSSAPETDEFDWIASVSAGTSIVFLMVDSEGRSGGSSDARTVDQTSDSSCLNASSPLSTTDNSSTATSTSTPTSTPTSAQAIVVKSGLNTGTIAGVVIGVLALLGFMALGVLYLRRIQRKSTVFVFEDKLQAYPAAVGNRGMSLMSRAFRPQAERAPASFDLLHSSSRSLPHMSPLPNASLSFVSAPLDDFDLPNPYILPSTNEASVGHSTQYPQSLSSFGARDPSQLSPILPMQAHTESENLHSPTSMLYTNLYSICNNHGLVRHSSMPCSVATGRSERTSGGGTGRTVPRLILHTDSEDIDFESDGEVVELPPQYNSRRPGALVAPNEKDRPPTPPPKV